MMQRLISIRLDQLISYLEPLLPLANCHMVDFFTKNVYETFIPLRIRTEIEQLGFLESLDAILTSNVSDSKCPELHKFLSNCRKHSLPNCKDVCMDLRDFKQNLIAMGCQDVSGLHLEDFMSSKKSHEVEIMSEIAAAICNIAKTDHLIDIGDGKGYLSSALAMYNGLKVLGVDSSHINTKGAAKRVDKLNKHWTGLTGMEKNSRGNDFYKRTTKFITQDVDLTKLVQDHFDGDQCSKLGLVGLHTCGNLAPSCLAIFNSNTDVKTICNVGCCYHLLDEDVSESFCGFPMSNLLKEKQFKLGRNARMLSCQSIDRILHGNELPSSILFYRALLQVLLVKHCPTLMEKPVGRFGQKSTTFQDYVQKAFKKFGTESVPVSEVNELYDSYVHLEKTLQIFYLLRAHLAPIIEAVILLDRLLFLHEQGWTQSFLVGLFDPVISPRCYAVISFKDDV